MINLKRLDPELPKDALGRGCLKPSPIHREDLALRTILTVRATSLSTLILKLEVIVKA